MKQKPSFLLSALLLILLAVAGVWRGHSLTPTTDNDAQIGGHFTLTNTQGKRVTEIDFKGRMMVVYLGYSHCPDICPTTLSMLSDVLKKLDTNASKLSVVFISLDTKNDSPQVLAEYLKAFDPRIIGLTGSEEEVKTVVRAYKAFSEPTPNAQPGNMLIAHSGLLYLMDGQGKYVSHFESGVKTNTLVEAINSHF